MLHHRELRNKLREIRPSEIKVHLLTRKRVKIVITYEKKHLYYSPIRCITILACFCEVEWIG